MFAKHRLEALSDGIFAVVMTLLVIDLKVPTDVAHGHIVEALRREAPSWLAFCITFGIAARYWVLQNRVFAIAEKFHQSAVSVTILFLGLVTVLPFTTALISRYGSDRIVFNVYCLNQALIGAALILKLEIIRRHGHIATTGEIASLRARLWALTLAMGLAGACTFLMPMRYTFWVPALVMFSIRRAYRDKPAAPVLLAPTE